MKIYKATFTTSERNLIAPKNWSKGICWRSSGYSDPKSIQYDTWLFKPNNDENAYYCNASNLQFGEAFSR